MQEWENYIETKENWKKSRIPTVWSTAANMFMWNHACTNYGIITIIYIKQLFQFWSWIWQTHFTYFSSTEFITHTCTFKQFLPSIWSIHMLIMLGRNINPVFSSSHHGLCINSSKSKLRITLRPAPLVVHSPPFSFVVSDVYTIKYWISLHVRSELEILSTKKIISIRVFILILTQSLITN